MVNPCFIIFQCDASGFRFYSCNWERKLWEGYSYETQNRRKMVRSEGFEQKTGNDQERSETYYVRAERSSQDPEPSLPRRPPLLLPDRRKTLLCLGLR